MRSLRAASLGMVMLAVVTACSSSGSKSSTPPSSAAPSASETTVAGGASANTASAPGISAHQILIGLAGDLTGPAAASMTGFLPAATARIEMQNAQGGINGRQLKLVSADDQSTAQGGMTAVSELIQSKNVFAILEDSTQLNLGDKIAHQNNVPVIGAAIDGIDWGTQPYTNMVATGGDLSPVGFPQYSNQAKVMQLAGATNVASLAIANIPPSITSGKEFTAAAKQLGLTVGYENYSLPLGTVDVTSTVLAMKSAKVDGFMSNMLEATGLAVIETAKQAGLKLIAPELITGYGQDILNNSSSLAAGQGAIFAVPQVPVELKTPGTQAEQAAFAQYAHFTGIPDLNWTIGWTAADLLIKGLQAAGSNPTRASVLDALHNLQGWTADGVLPQPADFSLADFGHSRPTSCGYFAQLKGTAFVPLNNGQPVCGNLDPSS